MAVMNPKLGLLDETDSGLDVDAMKTVSKGINTLHQQDAHRALLVVTHQERLLRSIVPDFVHVMVDGRIIESGGRGLAERVEQKGYVGIEAELSRHGA
jgi:Fe-S cluster assembly ATP-binding protein